MHVLNGKVALVTGAAKRIGRVLAHTLADAGADVAITYRDSDVAAEQTLRELGLTGQRSMSLRCDVRDPASVRAAVAAVVDEFGRLDLLVNNAGVFATAPLESITVEQWDEMFETNTRGAFLMAQAAYPTLERPLKAASSTLVRWAACIRGRHMRTTRPRRRRCIC